MKPQVEVVGVSEELKRIAYNALTSQLNSAYTQLCTLSCVLAPF
jgi:hypothetical protein